MSNTGYEGPTPSDSTPSIPSAVTYRIEKENLRVTGYPCRILRNKEPIGYINFPSKSEAATFAKLLGQKLQ